jgi:hypothetical protein
MTPSPTPSPSKRKSTPAEFSASLTEFSASAERLRRALRAAIASVVEGTATTRVLADRLGIDKSLAWKCVRLATVVDVASVLADIPGARGWPKVLKQFTAAGCPKDLVAEVDAAMREIRERLSRRGIERPMVLAMAGGLLDNKRQQTSMLRHRRNHFVATAGIYGASVKARLGARLLAPCRADPTGRSADIVSVSIIEGLERSRPGMPFEIFAPSHTTDSSTFGPIDASGALPPLLERFSSSISLGVEIRASESGAPGVVEFLQRRPDRTEPLRLAFGEVGKGIVPRYATPDDDLIELGMPTGQAAECHVLVSLLHRDLELASEPQAALYGTLVQQRYRTKWAERLRLPLEAQVAELKEPTVPPSLRRIEKTWHELLRYGAQSIGRELSEFRVFQIVVPYPPAPSSLVVRWRRPDAPTGATSSGMHG